MDVTELKRSRSARSRGAARRATGAALPGHRRDDVAGARRPTGRVSLANRRACEVLGARGHELLGHDWFELAVPGATSARRPARVRPPDRRAGPRFDGVRELGGHEGGRGAARRLAQHRPARRRGAASPARSARARTSPTPPARRSAWPTSPITISSPASPTAPCSPSSSPVRSCRAGTPAAQSACSASTSTTSSWSTTASGHAVGDELLVAVAQRLRSVKRHDDLLARAGGDEFFLLLTDLPADGRGARDVRGRAHGRQPAEPFAVAGVALHVSASVGVSLLPRDARRRGRAAAPRGHRDVPGQARRPRRPRGSTRPRSDDPLERLSLTARLRRSLDNGELELHYQPIFALDDGDAGRGGRGAPALAATPTTASSRPPPSSPPPSTAAYRADRRLGGRRALPPGRASGATSASPRA